MIPNMLTCNLLCMRPHRQNESDYDGKSCEPVLLNVYDMYDLNEYITNIGLGVYHSGVEVYGTEYAFGGHQHSYTGIFDMEPRDEHSLGEYFNMRGQLRFKQTIQIGFTRFTRDEIETIKNRMGRRFRGNRYHLINNNCNHFSAAFTKTLCRKSIPAWVNRLAYVSSFIPFLHRFLPKELLDPTMWQHRETQV